MFASVAQIRRDLTRGYTVRIAHWRCAIPGHRYGQMRWSLNPNIRLNISLSDQICYIIDSQLLLSCFRVGLAQDSVFARSLSLMPGPGVVQVPRTLKPARRWTMNCLVQQCRFGDQDVDILFVVQGPSLAFCTSIVSRRSCPTYSHNAVSVSYRSSRRANPNCDIVRANPTKLQHPPTANRRPHRNAHSRGSRRCQGPADLFTAFA